jgi:hypothetical protein
MWEAVDENKISSTPKYRGPAQRIEGKGSRGKMAWISGCKRNHRVWYLTTGGTVDHYALGQRRLVLEPLAPHCVNIRIYTTQYQSRVGRSAKWMPRRDRTWFANIIGERAKHKTKETSSCVWLAVGLAVPYFGYLWVQYTREVIFQYSDIHPHINLGRGNSHSVSVRRSL